MLKYLPKNILGRKKNLILLAKNIEKVFLSNFRSGLTVSELMNGMSSESKNEELIQSKIIIWIVDIFLKNLIIKKFYVSKTFRVSG